jgi:hypothetical protein
MRHTDCPTETNGLIDAAAYHRTVTDRMTRTVPWTEPGLRITRLRLLSDPGHPVWDVSYVHGQLGDEPVRVAVPFDHLPKGRVSPTIVAHARADGIYAKGLGILDAISTLT